MTKTTMLMLMLKMTICDYESNTDDRDDSTDDGDDGVVDGVDDDYDINYAW